MSLDQLRANLKAKQKATGRATTGGLAVVMPTNKSNNNQTLAKKFKPEVKWDPSIYPKFKKIKDWDSWRSSFEAIVKTHDVRNILNPNYVATALEDIDVSELKNNFMHTVFTKMLQVDSGQIIVAQHALTCNAQVIYKQLVQEATISTMSALHIRRIIKALTTLKISTWKGTAARFIPSWDDKMWELHTLLPDANHYSGAVKRRMLKFSVQLIYQFAQVKIINQNIVATGQAPMSYQQYWDTLMLQAIQHNACINAKAMWPKLWENQHHIKLVDPDLLDQADDNEDKDSDINGNCNNYTINMTMLGDAKDKATFIKTEVWQKLPPDIQKLICYYWQDKKKFNDCKANVTFVDNDNPDDKLDSEEGKLKPLDDEQDTQLLFYITKRSKFWKNKNKSTPIQDLLTTTYKPKPAYRPNCKKADGKDTKTKNTITVDGKKYQLSTRIR